MTDREPKPTHDEWVSDYTADISKPPTCITSTGAKMWLCVGFSKSIRRRIGDEYVVWTAEQASGMREYVLTREGEPVFSSQLLDGIGCHVDAIRADRMYCEKEARRIAGEREGNESA